MNIYSKRFYNNQWKITACNLFFFFFVDAIFMGPFERKLEVDSEIRATGKVEMTLLGERETRGTVSSFHRCRAICGRR